MTVSEFQDLLRGKLGDPSLEPFLLEYFMAGGRRMIETESNAYWMVGKREASLVSSTQSYSITSTTGNGWGLTDYKMHRGLWVREVAGTDWYESPIGSWKASLEEQSTSLSDRPRSAVVENDTIYMFPTPDTTYPYIFLYWAWTASSVTITDTDELLTRWPDLLLWASVIAGKRYQLNSPEAGAEFDEIFTKELERLKDFTNKRLGFPANQMSTREAAQVLQASGDRQ